MQNEKLVYTNADLWKKYHTNSSFKKSMDRNQQNFNQIQQQTIYADLSKANKQMMQIMVQNFDVKNIIGPKIYSNEKQIILIFSCFQPENSSDLQKFYLHFINEFKQPNKPFYLIYVNSSNSTKNKSWSKFKSEIMQQLPIKYLLFLEKLIIIRSSFLSKATSLIQFDTLNRFLRDKSQHYENLSKLFKDNGWNYNQLKNLLPLNVIQEEQAALYQPLIPLICNLNTNRQSFDDFSLQKFKIENESVKKPKYKGLSNYPIGQMGIPLTFQLLIYYFTQKTSRCQTEGIFRRCSSIDDELQLIKELSKQNYQILTQFQNSIAVASVMKKFIVSLDPPLIPYSTYDSILENYKIDSLAKHIRSMPIINFMTLMYFLKFVKEEIIPHSALNLMTLNNISICLAPCLMRFKQISPKQITVAPINIVVTKKMITGFDTIFGDSDKQRRICRMTYDICKSKQKTQNNQKNQNEKAQDTLTVIQPKKSRKFQSDSTNEQYCLSIKCPFELLQPANKLINNQTQTFSQAGSQTSSKHIKTHKEDFISNQQMEINLINVQQSNGQRKKNKIWQSPKSLSNLTISQNLPKTKSARQDDK